MQTGKASGSKLHMHAACRAKRLLDYFRTAMARIRRRQGGSVWVIHNVAYVASMQPIPTLQLGQAIRDSALIDHTLSAYFDTTSHDGRSSMAGQLQRCFMLVRQRTWFIWGRSRFGCWAFQSRGCEQQLVKRFLPWASGLWQVEEDHQLADPAVIYLVNACFPTCPSRAVIDYDS